MVLLLLIAGAHGVATALVRPLFQVSDEVGYFAAVQATHVDQFEAGTPYRSFAAPPDGFAVDFNPGARTAFKRLGERVYAAALRSGSAQSAALLLRLVLSVCGVVAVAATWLLARHVAPGNALVVWGAPLLVATHPVFMAFSAGITPDGLANALAAMAVWQTARFADGTSKGAEPLALPALAVGAVAFKDTALFLVPLIGLAWGARVHARWTQRRSTARRDRWLWLMPLLGTAALVLAWRVILATLTTAAGSPAARGLAPGGLLLAAAREVLRQGPSSFHSFWASLGNFGANAIDLPRGLLWVAGALTAVSLVGLGRYLARRPVWESEDHRIHAFRFVLLAIAGVAALALQPAIRQAATGANDLFQGRWLFPGLPALAVLGAIGVSTWMRRPERAVPILSLAGSTAAFVALVGVLVPAYYARFPLVYAASRLYVRGAYGAPLDAARIDAMLIRPEWASMPAVVWGVLGALLLLAVAWNVLVLRRYAD